MLDFQKLDVYRCSIEFLSLSRNVLAVIPKGNADLVDQFRRAAQSIPLNIAEGVGRSSKADKARHYVIARGSAMECASELDVMKVEDLVGAGEYERGIELLTRVVGMLTKMICV